jgi:hypothetical protein
MGLFDWAKSEAEDLGIISPPPASSQGLDNGLDALAAGSSHAVTFAGNSLGTEAQGGAQEIQDAMDGAATTQPIDDELAHDAQTKKPWEDPEAYYYAHPDKNPYNTAYYTN